MLTEANSRVLKWGMRPFNARTCTFFNVRVRENQQTPRFSIVEKRSCSQFVKTLTRLFLGLVSSLLLAAGLARVAQHLDPSAPDLAKAPQNTLMAGGSAPCNLPCYLPDENSDKGSYA